MSSIGQEIHDKAEAFIAAVEAQARKDATEVTNAVHTVIDEADTAWTAFVDAVTTGDLSTGSGG